MPVIKPKKRVFVMAFLKPFIPNISAKTEKVNFPSGQTLSISKMLKGYKIKSSKNKKIPAITVIKNGSANNFFLSSTFFCEKDIRIFLVIRYKQNQGNRPKTEVFGQSG